MSVDYLVPAMIGCKCRVVAICRMCTLFSCSTYQMLLTFILWQQHPDDIYYDAEKQKQTTKKGE